MLSRAEKGTVSMGSDCQNLVSACTLPVLHTEFHFSCQQHHQSSLPHLITIFDMIKLKLWYKSIDEKVSTVVNGRLSWLLSMASSLKSFVHM